MIWNVLDFVLEIANLTYGALEDLDLLVPQQNNSLGNRVSGQFGSRFSLLNHI